jgi:TPR repeat protein
LSYVVQIWEQPAGTPLPDRAESVWHMLARLRDGPRRRSERFAALGRRLQVLYPESDDADADDGAVWLDGAAGDVDEPVWNLGLYAGDRLDEVQARVAVQAMALGLNMADEQAGDLFLADGRILSRRDGAHCVHAFDAYFGGDHAGAWRAFVALAATGNSVALRNLGAMALNGDGVRRDGALGHALLSLAQADAEAAAIGRRLSEAEGRRAALLRHQLQRPDGFANTLARLQAPERALSLVPVDGDPPPLPIEAPATDATPGESALATLVRRAEQGDADACFDLGCRHKLGEGLPASDAQALHWWRLAAAQGQRDAQYNLGIACQHGHGTEADATQAFKWFGLAADANHPEAIYNLGVMHERGLVVPRDAVAAKALYMLARKLGSEHAKLPEFELGELSQAMLLASEMGGSGKVTATLTARRLARAERPGPPNVPNAPGAANTPDTASASRARAQPAAREPSSRGNRPDGRRPAGDDGAPRHGAWILLGCLALGLLGLPLLLALGPGSKALTRLLLVTVTAAAMFGVWRSERLLSDSGTRAVLLGLFAAVPGIGMWICLAQLLRIGRLARNRP